jgi:hypothetical protein
VTKELDTLATALYVKTDDLLKADPRLVPWRPPTGIAPQLSDAEVVTLAVLQALLGFTSEARWLRHARAAMGHLFPYLPGQPGCNKRLRVLAGTISVLTRVLARDTSIWSDDVWAADSTPVECGRSRDTARRSELAGWAGYGYCASHSRWFWGLRLHLVTTLHGLPVAFALTRPGADERQVLLAELDDPALASRAGQVILADKNHYGAAFEQHLAAAGITIIRPARKPGRPGPGPGSCARCARSSNRSAPPSNASSTSNDTAAAPQPASPSASCSASSPSPPGSGTTTTPASPSEDPSWPWTTYSQELTV